MRAILSRLEAAEVGEEDDATASSVRVREEDPVVRAEEDRPLEEEDLEEDTPTKEDERDLLEPAMGSGRTLILDLLLSLLVGCAELRRPLEDREDGSCDERLEEEDGLVDGEVEVEAWSRLREEDRAFSLGEEEEEEVVCRLLCGLDCEEDRVLLSSCLVVDSLRRLLELPG